MKVFLGCDHGGFPLKEDLKKFLSSRNLEVIDLGANELIEDDDYPTYAKLVSTNVNANSDSIGILICRSGIGMCIAANKFKGVYAALCLTPEHAVKAREHNNANVLCLDSDYHGEIDPKKIVTAFLEQEFSGWDSRHGRRVNQIKEIENVNFK